jgi:hypothetical protein
MVGGTIIDIVQVTTAKWWVNCAEHFDRKVPHQCAIYLNPSGEPLEVGDALWWQGSSAYWTPQDRSRVDVKLSRIGFSGVAHPHLPRCPTCDCTVAFCEKHGTCVE